MNFTEHMLPVKRESIFELEGFDVWCGTMAQGNDGKYYLYFSFWPKEKGHSAWVTHSQVGYAVSVDPLGPYEYAGVALAGSGNGWDRDVIHNPSIIKFNNTYYMYYMGNYGNGEYWDHRNHQRVGVAWAEKPQGPWRRFDKPLIDVSPVSGAYDSLLTSNPAVTIGSDGRFYMIYKAVSNSGELPKGGAVVCGIAVADNPLGPFVKHPEPVMVNPENAWSVEDAFIWFYDGYFYALAKDFQGYFTQKEEGTTALFESKDGLHWDLSKNALGFAKQISWTDGELQTVHRLERAQIWFNESGIPSVLFCACMDKLGGKTFNVHIPLGYFK